MTSREEEEDVETTCASTTGPTFMLDVTHPNTRIHIYALALIYTQMQKYIQKQSTPI